MSNQEGIKKLSSNEQIEKSAPNRALSRTDFLKIAVGSAGVIGGVASIAVNPQPVKAQGKGGTKTKIDTPVISCQLLAEVSITIRVCAPSGTGATGLPAGFSLQWMTAADYASNGNQWFLSDDPRLCKASFSGNANLSRYNLLAGQCVNVNVGDFLLDQGASTNCPDRLVCGTEYVFRAFGHATSTLTRSDFTANLTCSTLPCAPDDDNNCTYTQGYWKTHGPIPTGNNSNEWPVTSLMLGTVSYTDSQLLQILGQSVGGNGLIALAHQLIAAKLNVAKGADPTDVAGAIAAADTLIGSRVVPPVGAGSLTPSATSALITALTAYNEGATGPGHCDDNSGTPQ
jgi:hypothetical protein